MTPETPYIDESVSAYEELPYRLLQARLDHVGDGSALREPIHRFLSTWNGTATAFQIPWLFLDHMRGVHSFRESFEPLPVEAMRGFCDFVDQATKPLVVPYSRAAVIAALRAGDDDRHRALRQAQSEREVFDPAIYWGALTKDGSFRSLVARLMEMTYSAFCFAFEECVVTSLRLASTTPIPAGSSWPTLCAIADGIAPAGTAHGLRDSRIKNAHLALIDLVHNGGRPGPQLRRLVASGTSDLRISDGRIGITASAVRNLFDLLGTSLASFLELAAPRCASATVPASFGARMDNRLEVYEPFTHGSWRAELVDAAKGSALEPLAEALAAEFDEVSKAHQLPAFLPHRVHRAMLRKLKPGERVPQQLFEVFKGVACDLGGPLSILTDGHRSRLLALLSENERLTHQVLDRGAREILLEVWGKLATDPPFVLFVRLLCQMCYSMLYFAYEAFATGCLRVALGDPSFRLPTLSEPGRSSAVDVAALARRITPIDSTHEMINTCFGDEEIVTAAVVRDCIRHGNGRASDILIVLSPRIEAQDGFVNVDAADVRELHVQVRKRALRLVRGLRHLPSVRISSGAR